MVSTRRTCRIPLIYLLRRLACLLVALGLASTAAAVRAQAPDALPPAPEPQIIEAQQRSQAGVSQFLLAAARDNAEGAGAEEGVEGRGPQDAPVVLMAAHHGNDRYWLSGQANIIYQGRLPFHSLYEGTNSFHSSAEYKTSLLGTLYMALRPTRSVRYNTDLILADEA